MQHTLSFVNILLLAYLSHAPFGIRLLLKDTVCGVFVVIKYIEFSIIFTCSSGRFLIFARCSLSVKLHLTDTQTRPFVGCVCQGRPCHGGSASEITHIVSGGG